MSLAQLKIDIKAVFNDLTGKTANVKGDEVATAIWNNSNLGSSVKTVTPYDSLTNTNEVVSIGETAIDVVDGTKLAIGQVICIADDKTELMLITNIVGNTITVTKGYAGTSDKAHATATDIFICSYIMADDDAYTIYECDTTTYPACIMFPTFAAYTGPEFEVINKVGTYKAKAIPEGAELCNGYGYVDITEKLGWWRFAKTATEWRGITDGNSTIIETSTVTADATMLLTTIWEDVTVDDGTTKLSVTLTPGNYLVSARCNQYVSDSGLPSDIRCYFGLGTTINNVAPNILRMDTYREEVKTIANTMVTLQQNHLIKDEPITITANKTIYMKVLGYSDEDPISAHACYGDVNCPMYIRARRIS